MISKAIFTEKGKHFEIQTIDTHVPQKGEILITNHAIATNPADPLIQKSGHFVQDYPCILGCDVAGVVEEVSSITESTNILRWEKVKGVQVRPNR